MTFQVYLDEDFSEGARVDAINLIGIDALSAPAARMLKQTDYEQLSFAESQNRLILTHNSRDFARIHGEVIRAGGHHAGICILKKDLWLGPGEIARRLLVLAETFRDLGTRDQLLFLANFS